MSALLLAAAFGTAVQAAVLGARATGDAVPNPVFAEMPLITAPPVMRALGKRQEELTILVAPDNTCGYLEGISSVPYACDTTANCAFITSQSVGAVACCADSGCGFHVDCIESKDAGAGCDATCRSDTHTLKCTNGAQPFCGTVSFFNGIVDFFCNSAQLRSPIQAYTTYSGQASRTFSPVAVTLTGSSTGGATGGGSSRTAKGSASGTSPTKSASGSTGTSGSEESGDDHSTNGSSGTPVGAIVGGVVGGVGGLALIGFGVFFLIRHSNKKKKAGAGNVPKWAAGQTGGAPPQLPPGAFSAAAVPPGGPYPADSQKVPLINQYHAEVASDHGSYTSPVSPPGSVTPYQPPPHSNLAPAHTQAHEAGSTPIQPPVYEAGGDAVGAPGSNANHRGQFHELH